MLKNLKSFASKIGRKGKALICCAITVVSSCIMSVVASAEEVTSTATGLDMEALMTEAGTSLQNSLTGLVKTMIPVILGIAGSGLVVFGIIALIRLAKKIFGKVAG